ncbi:hypothetical protein DA83_25205 [Pseudomonas sp. 250J]|uniref:hypothetical protein n=1 Tax=unclassified Pseudomonas TaxID=196821 RepID=UPI00068105E3|nr:MULTISPECIES: hypothetical protein [unclassified Pseudomonas]KNX78051.1 hypothetical protein DA83_25205 [Pseudomonas sp. 250J]QZA57161.1 N-acetyltransferase [Pseudomonas sp. 2hn]
MALFDPLRDFYQRRQAAQLDRQASGLQLVTERHEAVPGNFFYPGPTITAVLVFQGQPAGHVRYGQSPLADRLYVCHIQINPAQRLQGLGQAALWRLCCQYQVPLTPLQEVGTAFGFWSTVRQRFAAAGVEVTPDIRTAEQDTEQRRWQHLVPEPEHKRQIRALMASPEWPVIKARLEAEYGPCQEN